MKTIINIQSISDIITNSSTEIYTVATDNTIKSVKNLINSVLKLSGNNNVTFDDLFTIKLSYDSYIEFEPADLITMLPVELGKTFAKELKYFEECDQSKYSFVKNDEYDKKAKEFVDKFINTVPNAISYLRQINDYGAFDIGLCVESKNKNNEIAKNVAKSLSGLGIINDYDQVAIYG